jgi:hypothetical protein
MVYWKFSTDFPSIYALFPTTVLNATCFITHDYITLNEAESNPSINEIHGNMQRYEIACPEIATASTFVTTSLIFFSGAGYAVAHLLEALRDKPGGRCFDSRWGHWNFSVT